MSQNLFCSSNYQRSQIAIKNIIMIKKLETLWEFSEGDKRHEADECCWKNGASVLAGCSIATNLRVVKKQSSICKAQWYQVCLCKQTRGEGLIWGKQPPFHPLNSCVFPFLSLCHPSPSLILFSACSLTQPLLEEKPCKSESGSLNLCFPLWYSLRVSMEWGK